MLLKIKFLFFAERVLNEAILIVDLSHLQVQLDLFDAYLYLLLTLRIFHCYLISDVLQYIQAPLNHRGFHESWETYSDINDLQIASHDNLCTDGISLFLPIIFMPAFGNWSFDENVCVINSTYNLRGISLIFCFKRFNSSRSFDFFLREFYVITGTLDNRLTREKKDSPKVFDLFLNRSLQSYLHSNVFTQRSFKRLFKISRKFLVTFSKNLKV